MLDAHLRHGNELRLDPTRITWPRVSPVNDGARRKLVGLGGPLNGVPRESFFEINEASEVMAIVALAQSRADLRRRLGQIVLGQDLAGAPVRARLAGAADVRREQSFAFTVGEDLPVLHGILDVIAREEGGGAVVVDYKTNRVEGLDLAVVVRDGYALQRDIYALARERSAVEKARERADRLSAGRGCSPSIPRRSSPGTGTTAR